jgi:anthranilate phosphoribosyltransferase
MNSAYALIAAGKSDDVKTAVGMAADSIDSGRAAQKLDEVRRVSNAL